MATLAQKFVNFGRLWLQISMAISMDAYLNDLHRIQSSIFIET